MAREFSKSFYNSSRWQKTRAAFLSAHPYCRRHELAGIIVPAEHVHHIVELTPDNVSDPDVSLNWNNLEALCHDCHTREHTASPQVDDGLYFDADGNLRPVGPPVGTS